MYSSRKYRDSGDLSSFDCKTCMHHFPFFNNEVIDVQLETKTIQVFTACSSLRCWTLEIKHLRKASAVGF